jgi:hypothetical protein
MIRRFTSSCVLLISINLTNAVPAQIEKRREGGGAERKAFCSALQLDELVTIRHDIEIDVPLNPPIIQIEHRNAFDDADSQQPHAIE